MDAAVVAVVILILAAGVIGLIFLKKERRML
jgi:hypothetical protein